MRPTMLVAAIETLADRNALALWHMHATMTTG